MGRFRRVILKKEQQWYDEFYKALQLNGLDDNRFLYTVIDGDRIDEFLVAGTYRPDDMIFAFTAEQLVFENESRDSFDLNRAFAQYENPALVVYRASNFRGNSETYLYWFKNPEKKQSAVEAVVEFEFV